MLSGLQKSFLQVGKRMREWEKSKYATDPKGPLKPFLDLKSSENLQKARGFSQIHSHRNFIFQKRVLKQLIRSGISF